MEALSKHLKLVTTLFLAAQLLGARIDPSGLPGSPQDFTLTICVPLVMLMAFL